MGPSRLQLSKPVIAAVEGFCVAGGLELACWCDLRVCSSTAVFGVFCRKWGVPLIDGGTFRLPRLIGQSRAADMILTGRAVSAGEALEWGLANRMFNAGLALDGAIELALQIAAHPQPTLRADRDSMFRSYGRSVDDCLRHEFTLGSTVMGDAEAGALAFQATKQKSKL
jgi:enoyl-CoA hydratase